MNQTDSFSYWRKPWHKWMVLGGALLQTIGLCYQIREYRRISSLENRATPFSPLEWEHYAANQQFQFAIIGMVIGLFLACFLIGFFVRSKRTTNLSTGILLLIFSALWCVAGVVIPVFTQRSMTIAWIILLISFLGGSLYSFWSSRR